MWSTSDLYENRRRVRTLQRGLGLLGAASMLCCPPASGSSAASDETEALIELLREKGVLTQEEASSLRKEAEARADEMGPADAKMPKTQPEPPPNGYLHWENGLNFGTKDDRFRGAFGGRIMWDVAAFATDPGLERMTSDADRGSTIGNIPSATEFRRARLYTSGELALSVPIDYKLQVDFAGGNTSLKDAYVGFDDLPLFNRIRFGHIYEPFSLEQQTSSKYIQFMERAAPIEAFSPGRSTGLRIDRPFLNERMTWGFGAFTAGNAGGDGQISGNHHVSTRVTALPFYQAREGGDKLWHVGVSGRFVNPDNNMSRFRSRPEAHLAPRFVDTGTFAADSGYTVAPEAAFVWGPYSLQGEYFHQWVDASRAGDPAFHGFYVAGKWFLTGEHRPYDRGSGEFGRVIPHENVSLTDGGIGAWSVGVRYSNVDLTDTNIRGGKMNSLTLGLNWHFNPQARLMLNYGLAEVERRSSDGQAHLFQTRVQVDF